MDQGLPPLLGQCEGSKAGDEGIGRLYERVPGAVILPIHAANFRAAQKQECPNR